MAAVAGPARPAGRRPRAARRRRGRRPLTGSPPRAVARPRLLAALALLAALLGGLGLGGTASATGSSTAAAAGGAAATLATPSPGAVVQVRPLGAGLQDRADGRAGLQRVAAAGRTAARPGALRTADRSGTARSAHPPRSVLAPASPRTAVGGPGLAVLPAVPVLAAPLLRVLRPRPPPCSRASSLPADPVGRSPPVRAAV